MTRGILCTLAVVVGLAVSACAGSYRGRTVTTAELTMVYDPGLRVYVVETVPGVYYYGGVYYRLQGGGWERSSKAHGPWRACKKHHLPPGLRKKM